MAVRALLLPARPTSPPGRGRGRARAPLLRGGSSISAAWFRRRVQLRSTETMRNQNVYISVYFACGGWYLQSLSGSGVSCISRCGRHVCYPIRAQNAKQYTYVYIVWLYIIYIFVIIILCSVLYMYIHIVVIDILYKYYSIHSAVVYIRNISIFIYIAAYCLALYIHIYICSYRAYCR